MVILCLYITKKNIWNRQTAVTYTQLLGVHRSQNLHTDIRAAGYPTMICIILMHDFRLLQINVTPPKPLVHTWRSYVKWFLKNSSFSRFPFQSYTKATSRWGERKQIWIQGSSTITRSRFLFCKRLLYAKARLFHSLLDNALSSQGLTCPTRR